MKKIESKINIIGERYAYLSEYDYNWIGDMIPGEGYKLKVSADDKLTYLPNYD